jgi:hypothetical protein
VIPLSKKLKQFFKIIHACAFNFPAVLQAFGASRWTQMSKMFTTIMKKSSEVKINKY